MTRRLLTAGALSLLAAATVAIGPGPASAAAGADQITITGDDLAEPLEVRLEDDPELFAAVHSEVNWLIGRASHADRPDEETRGPRYRLVVHVDGEARHRFSLYPLAEGGPRAYRPSEQPGDRTVRSGWFYGRLSMPNTLVSAGVPLGDGDGPGGGVGGGDAVPSEEPAAPGLSAVLDEWREGLRLTAVITVAIVIGLGGVALLIRRRV